MCMLATIPACKAARKVAYTVAALAWPFCVVHGTALESTASPRNHAGGQRPGPIAGGALTAGLAVLTGLAGLAGLAVLAVLAASIVD